MGQIKYKEFGSDFHYCFNKKWLSQKPNQFLTAKTNFISGRAALYSLIQYGIKTHNWKNIYLPSYYCHEVEDYIKDLPVKIIIYKDNPLNKKIINLKEEQNSAIIAVDYFGNKKHVEKTYQETSIIKDVTHNLKSIKKTETDYAFASLRKELPVPTGGIIFSNKNKNLPEGKNVFEANKIALLKLNAMFLKTQYLLGEIGDKELFRKHFIDSENGFSNKLKDAKNSYLSNEILKHLDITSILNQKQKNISFVQENLNKAAKKNIYKNTYGLIFKFSNGDLREKFKSYLISNSIYPAILWPNQISLIDKELEKTILFIHVDYRYSEKDLNKIIIKINSFFNEKI